VQPLHAFCLPAHALPTQQPFGHDVASQTHPPVVVSHRSPAAHTAHVTVPPHPSGAVPHFVPHAWAALNGWQTHVPACPAAALHEVCPPVHVPQLSVGHPGVTSEPQLAPDGHVVGQHCPVEPLHASVAGHVPHDTVPLHPSGA
jgi:hypothetical protein